MGVLEKISEIEKEIARTQKNKGIKYVLGSLVLVDNCKPVKREETFGLDFFRSII